MTVALLQQVQYLNYYLNTAFGRGENMKKYHAAAACVIVCNVVAKQLLHATWVLKATLHYSKDFQ